MENNPSFLGIISTLYHTFFKLIKDVCDLAATEARIAKKSLTHIIMMALLAVAFLMATWLSFCVVILLWLVSLQFSWILSASIVTVLNLFMVMISIAVILKLNNNLNFNATRRQLNNIRNINKDFTNEHPETTSIENKVS